MKASSLSLTELWTVVTVATLVTVVALWLFEVLM
jgi:hypothetical protein